MSKRPRTALVTFSSRDWLAARTKTALDMERQAAVDSYTTHKHAKQAYEDAKKERLVRSAAKTQQTHAQPLDWCMELGTPWRASTEFFPAPIQYHVNRVLTAFLLGFEMLQKYEHGVDMDFELVEDTLKQIRVYETRPNVGPQHALYQGQYVGDRRLGGALPGVRHPFEGKCEFQLHGGMYVRGFIVGNDMYCTASNGDYSGMAQLTVHREHIFDHNFELTLRYHGLGSILMCPVRAAYDASCSGSAVSDFVAFTGMWEHDTAVSGVVTFPCGSTYTGTWKDGQSDGAGVYSHPCRHCLDVSRFAQVDHVQHKLRVSQL